MKDWKKRIVALLLIFAVCVIEPQMIAKAASNPAPTVTKKTLYVGYKNYTIKMKNLEDGSKVTYTSSDKKVATVTSKGVISPVAAGKATITVKVTQSKKTYTGKITVTVKEPYVKMTDKITTITAGLTYQFAGKTYGLKKTSVSWTSSNKKVVTIDAKTGELKAVAAGSANITFKDKTSGKSVSCKVKVVKASDDIGDFQIVDGILEKYSGSKKDVTIPAGVTSIGNAAFYGCSSLSSITIPNSVTSIEACAFDNCSSLSSITIPNSVTNIGVSAFYGCSSLSSITLPKSVTSIAGWAFGGCSNNLVIYGAAGSYAEEFAEDCGITFKEK